MLWFHELPLSFNVAESCFKTNKVVDIFNSRSELLAEITRALLFLKCLKKIQVFLKKSPKKNIPQNLRFFTLTRSGKDVGKFFFKSKSKNRGKRSTDFK